MVDSFGNQTKKWMEERNCLKKCGPYLFNLFINDLDFVSCLGASLRKYADDTMMQVIVNRAELIVQVM